MLAYQVNDPVKLTDGTIGVITEVIPPGLLTLSVRYVVQITGTDRVCVRTKKDFDENTRATLKLVTVQPLVTVSKTARDLFKTICAYDGKQLSDWNPVEGKLFSFIADWFEVFLQDKGVVASQPPVRDTVNQDLKAIGMGGKLGNATPLFGYTLTSPKQFLGAIRDIGNRAESNTAAYVLYFNNSRVFLSAGDHYAYPLVLNGAVPDYQQYEHSYVKLMDYGCGNGSKDDCLEVIKTGALPDDLKLATVLVANLVSESDRNWVQLLSTLFEMRFNHKATFQSHKEGRFPMGGGGWKNKGTWGKGRNPHADGGCKDADSYQPKRWLTGLVIQGTIRASDGDPSELWMKLIDHLLGTTRDPKSDVDVKAALKLSLDKACRFK